MFIKRCPSCNKVVGFVSVISPAFKGKGEAIQCKKCNEIISEPWGKHIYWLPALGMPIGLLVPGYFVKKFELPEIWSWYILLIIFAALIGAMYLLAPINKKNTT